MYRSTSQPCKERKTAALGTAFFWYCTIPNVYPAFRDRSSLQRQPQVDQNARSALRGWSLLGDQGADPPLDLGPALCSPLRTIVISEILALSQGVAFCLFLLFLFSFQMSSRHPSSWPVRNSDCGPPVVWIVSTEAAGNCCSHSHKTSVLKKKRESRECVLYVMSHSLTFFGVITCL